MAYPTVSGPYGFQPINLIGGQVFAGSTRLFPITTGSTTAIFFGDVVRLNTGGTLSKVSTTATATDAVGIFLGCQFTNPSTKQLLQQQFYPGSITASDIQAFVLDDPDALFKVAVTAAGTSTISGVTQAAVGLNTAIILTAGSTTTGDSLASVSATTAGTSTLPFRIVAGIPETVNASGSFTEVIVKFNFGTHTYYSATGVATAA
jgi:hypothetical protein